MRKQSPVWEKWLYFGFFYVLVSLETPTRPRATQRFLHSQILEMGGVACRTTWKNTRAVRRQETEAGGGVLRPRPLLGFSQERQGRVK